jgi:hypothetical protein
MFTPQCFSMEKVLNNANKQGCTEGVFGGGCSPAGKFRPEKISKEKFNPLSNFGNFQS